MTNGVDPMNTPLTPAEPYTAEGVAEVRTLLATHTELYGSQEPFIDEPMIARLLATIDALTADLTAARAQLAMAEEALTFYADPDTYICGRFDDGPIGDDCDESGEFADMPGMKARAALATVTATPEQPSREGEGKAT